MILRCNTTAVHLGSEQEYKREVKEVEAKSSVRHEAASGPIRPREVFGGKSEGRKLRTG